MASFPERIPRYAELQVTTNFSFLRGAAHPDELMLTAAASGHQAIAITDRNSFAGIVRAHHAAKEVGIRLVVGCRLDLRDGTRIVINSHRAARQIWMAAVSTAWHFDPAGEGVWRASRTGEELRPTLSRLLHERIGLTVSL